MEGAKRMGKLKEMGFTMLQNVPEGTCPKCAVKHPQEQPHNRDSLFTSMNFMMNMDAGLHGKMQWRTVRRKSKCFGWNNCENEGFL